MQWFGKPVNFNRFLGQCDSDDPTNLPIGLAAVCRNTDFTRDSPGVTCAGIRAGINLAMQMVALDGTKSQLPVTGAAFFAFSPELVTQSRFEMPIAFEAGGSLQREYPVGTGRMQAIANNGLFVPPANTSMLAVPADNKVWAAFSNLKEAGYGACCIDPNVIQTGVPVAAGISGVNPLGLKPVGWYWQPNTPVLAGEICCPAAPVTGNGHTYQAQNAGTTGANQPVWPLTEAGTVNDNGVVWKERTMVMANRLPAPPAPVLAVAGGGAFPANKDVYVVITLVNNQGETLPSAPSIVADTVLDDSISCTIPALAALPGWESQLAAAYIPNGANVYVASVATGSAAPPLSAYARYNGTPVALGATVALVGPASGISPTTPGASIGVTQTGNGTSTATSTNAGGFPSVACPGSTATLDFTLDCTLTEFEGGGAAIVEYTSDLEPVWTGIGSLNVSGSSSLSPSISVNNLDSVQVRVFVTASAGPAGNCTVDGNVSGLAATLSGGGAGVAPPSSCTARITPGQLPTPDVEPVVERDPGAGTFPAGRDVYVLQTYTNAQGETKAGPANSIINTVLNDAAQVTVAVPEDENDVALYSIASVGIYEADVPTGQPAPSSTEFSLVGYYQPGATPLIGSSASGPNPPNANTTGPGGAVAADTATGGPNNGQGFRYAALLFMNQNETVSGFTLGSVIQYDVDEDGWELAFFNIAAGPGNVVARLVAITTADSSQDGPFNWLGLIDLIVPTQNVVYPMTVNSNGVAESATAIFDNVTTSATFNFDDDFLLIGNNVDDRTDILPPFQPVRIDYLKSINALAFTGVKGYTGGGLISIPGDPESVYADTGALPFPSDGQRCYGFTDAYKSVIFALREEGGYAVEPNSGNPASWTVVRRWSDVGPCGFRAWDANGKFIIFVHRSGCYKYDESDPDMMSKEVPRQWSTINWAAAHQIAVTIDEDTHTVRIQVPVNGSTVNNQEFCLSYLEGWQNPIHFSTFSGKEISMDAARRWSFNDVAANLCIRMNRTLPPGPAFVDGPDWTTMPDSSYRASQLLYCSSAYDGTVQARTPGLYSDNGTGIDWQWESVCAGLMQAVSKAEGFNLNCTGHGTIFASLLPARVRADGPADQQKLIIKLLPIELENGQQVGITRKCPPAINEFWRVRFTNGKQPGAWCSLKQMNFYVIPFTGGRDR